MSSNEEVQALVNANKLPEAVALAKGHAIEALQSAALICSRLGACEETLKFAKLCLDIEPNSSKLYGNLSYYLCKDKNPLEALAAIDKALELEPNAAEFVYCRAVILSSFTKRIKEAVKLYRKGLELDPDSHVARFNLGCMLMFLGEYSEALPCLEERFKYDGKLMKFHARFNKPDWDGKADLTNKRLLIYSEQGCGDVIHYVRYVPLLPKTTLIAEMPEELVSLLSGFFDIVVGRAFDFNVETPMHSPEYDYIVSFSSLPYLLDPDLTKIPKTPYLSVSKPYKFSHEKFNVGIVWAGSGFHVNDLNRSCQVRNFLPISKIPNVQLYSMQLGDMKRDYWGQSVDWREGFEEFGAIDLAGKIDNFYTTAQMIQGFDLVITVDTAVAHLAGALGKPVWVLLSYCHDYRWLLHKKKTLWYPTMRLFHQKNIGDWKSVMKEIVNKLTNLT